MSPVIWLPESLADVERLFHFLHEKNPQAAAKAMQAIRKGSDLLAEMPRAGRPMADGAERRELFVPFGAAAYVLRYMLRDEDAPVMLRVWHSRELRR